MSNPYVLSLIAAAPPTLVALAGFVVSLRNRKAIQEVHVRFHSRMDAYQKVEKKGSHDEGVRDEKTMNLEVGKVAAADAVDLLKTVAADAAIALKTVAAEVKKKL